MIRNSIKKLGKRVVSNNILSRTFSSSKISINSNKGAFVNPLTGFTFSSQNINNFNLTQRRFESTTPEKFEFQAETRKLLDIVTNSIYTDKDVFLRELISNASDALEKLRYKKTTGEVTTNDDLPLEIHITTDPEKKTITISDNGIGMSKDDLISNLGTIARSGSKQFVEQLKAKGMGSSGQEIIGQFGVGFYSAFMVSEYVTVESAPADNSSVGHIWTSDGSGSYTILPSPNPISRGVKLTMKIKDTCVEYAEIAKIEEIIKRYSNFVSFPIKLNGNPVNTVSAIWLQDKNSVTEAQYDDFYKFIANAFDKPTFTLHFRTDAPLDLKALFFFPSFHTEKFGMGRMEPGTNLYSRKVLIESKPKDLLPDWLR